MQEYILQKAPYVYLPSIGEILSTMYQLIVAQIAFLIGRPNYHSLTVTIINMLPVLGKLWQPNSIITTLHNSKEESCNTIYYINLQSLRRSFRHNKDQLINKSIIGQKSRNKSEAYFHWRDMGEASRSGNMPHFYHHHLRLILHFESKDYQTFSDSFCARATTRRLIILGK